MRVWRRNYLVLTAGVVHGLWGFILFFGDAPLHTTPMGHFPIAGGMAATFYVLASYLAFVPHYAVLSKPLRLVWPKCPERLDEHYAGLLLTLPQQGLLMLSFFTAALAIARGQYPDGYVPDKWGSPQLFILVDQLWAMLGMLFHTLSLLDWYWWSRLPERRKRP